MSTNPDLLPVMPKACHFTHILAPVDFSEACLYGLSTAAGLARRSGAKLTVMHVVKHLPHGSRMVLDAAELQQEWQRCARENLAEFVRAHVPEDVHAEQVVREGKAFDVIVREAAKRGCDLIVTATHGYTGLAHVLIGSTAERIVQHAACPVLVVRGRGGQPSEELAPRWILVPTDFSDNSRKAFPFATALALEFGAKLILAHVKPGIPMTGEIPLNFTQEQIDAVHAQAEVRLRQFRTEHFSEHLDTTTLVLEGNAHECLIKAVISDDPGIIVMSTHGHTGWQHALLGSTAERVVRHATCSVLVVR
ncbi:MAG: universal stress protein [Prosthecobacter sp.]|nr:universal stress protein [Prosthecobacter sp.]